MSNIVDRLAVELTEWVTGARSHLNVFMRVENGPEHRQETLVNTARADAAEVDRLRAAIQAEIALEARTPVRPVRDAGDEEVTG